MSQRVKRWELFLETQCRSLLPTLWVRITRQKSGCKQTFSSQLSLTANGMLATCSSFNSLWLSHLICTISFKYTSHHGLSVLQSSNFSKYHICLLILVGVPSATALLQLGIPFLPPLKMFVHIYFQAPLKVSPHSLAKHTLSGHLATARASDSC